MSVESIREAVERESEPDAAPTEEAPAEGAAADGAAEPVSDAEGSAVAVHSFDPDALARDVAAHHKRLRKTLGPVFDDLHSCEACDGIGVRVFDAEPEPEPVYAPYLEACKGCNGFGQVLTGASEPGQPFAPCRDCAGSGYVTKAEPIAAVTYMPSPENGGTVAGAMQPPLAADPAMLDRLRAAGYVIMEPAGAPVPPSA